MIKFFTAAGKNDPTGLWRMGAYPFFALITLPAVVLLGLACANIFINLNKIQEVTELLRAEHLPGIMSSQRALANVETLRRNAESVYTSDDARARRASRLDAQALVAESQFDSSPHFARFADEVQTLIFDLDKRKTQGDAAANDLHHSELLLAGALGHLRNAFDLPVLMYPEHNARHITSTPQQEEARLRRTEDRLAPLFTLCMRADLPPEVRAQCTIFHAEWGNSSRMIREKTQADQAARRLWQRLDVLLREMSDAISMDEARRAYRDMERINVETHNARLTFYISCLLLVGLMVGFAVVMHRYLLAPIALAARALRTIHRGRPARSIPPVRIRELQALLNLLPSLQAHMFELYARSGALEQEKNTYATLSLSDALTGVNNRRSFDQRLAVLEQSHAALGLLMLDVDLFKNYNDTYGHQAGDDCLVAVAHALDSALLRTGDAVFRYGGEEFAVILPDASEKACRSVSETLLGAVRSLQLPHASSQVAPFVTVSIGAAFRYSDDPIDDRELVARADNALYCAKKSGRNRACMHGESPLGQGSP